MKYILILTDTERSKKYLEVLCKNKIFPDSILFYSLKKNTNLLKKIKKTKVKYNYFNTNNLSNLKISKFILKSEIKNFVYSGYPGEIVSSKITSKKNLIHCHPGILPKFKGSTTLYYSLLLDKKIHCTCIHLNNNIDEGKILYIKKFSKPKKISLIENEYDNLIRSKTLVEYLKKGKQKKLKTNKKINYQHYYVAHPLIRQIVIGKKALKLG